jgi:hypothetical protein
VEGKCPRRNTIVCLSVLAALNLGVLLLAAQLSVPSLSFSRAAERFNAQAQPVSAALAGSAPALFQRCSGGGSVNCHADGTTRGR